VITKGDDNQQPSSKPLPLKRARDYSVGAAFLLTYTKPPLYTNAYIWRSGIFAFAMA
jgi:hypothetical protein